MGYEWNIWEQHTSPSHESANEVKLCSRAKWYRDHVSTRLKKGLALRKWKVVQRPSTRPTNEKQGSYRKANTPAFWLLDLLFVAFWRIKLYCNQMMFVVSDLVLTSLWMQDLIDDTEVQMLGKMFTGQEPRHLQTLLFKTLCSRRFRSVSVLSKYVLLLKVMYMYTGSLLHIALLLLQIFSEIFKRLCPALFLSHPVEPLEQVRQQWWTVECKNGPTLLEDYSLYHLPDHCSDTRVSSAWLPVFTLTPHSPKKKRRDVTGIHASVTRQMKSVLRERDDKKCEKKQDEW